MKSSMVKETESFLRLRHEQVVTSVQVAKKDRKDKT